MTRRVTQMSRHADVTSRHVPHGCALSMCFRWRAWGKLTSPEFWMSRQSRPYRTPPMSRCVNMHINVACIDHLLSRHVMFLYLACPNANCPGTHAWHVTSHHVTSPDHVPSPSPPSRPLLSTCHVTPHGCHVTHTPATNPIRKNKHVMSLHPRVTPCPA